MAGRAVQIAILAPFIGLGLLSETAMQIATKAAGTAFEAPPLLIYIFGIWIAFIVTTAALARHLGRIERTTDTPDVEDTQDALPLPDPRA